MSCNYGKVAGAVMAARSESEVDKAHFRAGLGCVVAGGFLLSTLSAFILLVDRLR
jgi:hypothetical protein